MKKTRLLAAAVLVMAGLATQPERLIRGVAAEPVGDAMAGELPALEACAYPDFPPYPPGFSSYRGLGFMGICCERLLPCESTAWANYDPHAHLAGPGLAWRQMRLAGGPAWGDKSVRFRGPGCGLFRASQLGFKQQAIDDPSQRVAEPELAEPEPVLQEAVPEDAASQETIPQETDREETIPEETVPLPAETEAGGPAVLEKLDGQTAGMMIPSWPNLPGRDRSATRTDLRRLPGITSSY
jgi:hypothetical protein